MYFFSNEIRNINKNKNSKQKQGNKKQNSKQKQGNKKQNSKQKQGNKNVIFLISKKRMKKKGVIKNE